MISSLLGFLSQFKSTSGKAHTLTHQLDSITGLPVPQLSIGGVVPVTTTGASGPTKDRILTNAGIIRLRVSWLPGQGPKNIILVTNHADIAKVCFNAPSTSTADAWLAQTYDGLATIMHKSFNNASPIEEREFTFSEPLTTLDFLPTVNITQLKVLGV